MKDRVNRRVAMWILCAFVVGGLGYSTLVLSARPVYASSCDCSDDQVEAAIYCENHIPGSQLGSFTCPYAQTHYVFTCSFDGFEYGPYETTCE
jgi:hypothetical protein